MIQHRTHGRLVVASKIVVYEHEHLLVPERRVVAAQLLDVAHDVRVQQVSRLSGASGNAPALAPVVFQGERPAQIVLGLHVGLHELQVQRAQKARRLAQQGDDSCVRRHLRDPLRGGVRSEV